MGRSLPRLQFPLTARPSPEERRSKLSVVIPKNPASGITKCTTQFHSDQSLNLEGTARHLEAMIAAGIHGVVLLGTVGENTALEYHEKLTILREMKHAVAGRMPVLTGVAEYTTALACRFARDAEEIGVDGLMVLPAMVYKSDERETLTHYRTVARATGMPIMVYNNPVSYSVDISPEAFARLADEPTLVAIKESSGKSLIFLDDDAWISIMDIQGILRFFDEHRDVGEPRKMGLGHQIETAPCSAGSGWIV